MAHTPAPTVIFFDLGDTLTFVDANNQRQRYADALDTLQVLRERGYRLGLLSDQSAGVTVTQIHTLLTGLGLAAYIERDLITLSTEIPGNVGKPNRPIFDLALQKAGHHAAGASSIFVTETLSHIQAARDFGWRAILKRNTGACQPAEGECVAGLSGLLRVLPPLAAGAGGDANFQLAPPPRLVDGLWAAPIDIQRINATLTFDGAASSGAGDATLEFKMGPHAGNPIFDLRQTITAAWLDGTPLPVAQLARHDFGGGADAGLRVVEAVLAAGSAHTLRVTYALGAPQASTAGSYQPAMTWSSGPRLAFNFGFTDLGAGRYLEAWVPANLIFDQFELRLELRVLNTSVTHTVISNGAVTALGTNHWQVNFPARFTALSPLLELRASDTLAGDNDSIVLPVSGANVAIEAWKLNGNGVVNLATQINAIKTHLAANENSTGAYMHGGRFVAFLNVGGMEYEGGTTTATGALRHEAFHSWWARGVKPASQPDAWFDEAWTVYNDAGAFESLPFDFTDPPVTLAPRNPWIRVTSSGAYTDGYRFWKGVAALIGVNTLNTLMSDFYKQRRQRPVTTMTLEEFLLCRTGNAQLVDGFHRFVYGFGNAAPAPDLWLRDDPAHTGDAWPGRFWDSPDVWVRTSDDGGLTHQSPEFGQDNWLYARVRNRGAATVRHFVVTFNVKQFAGTQFAYPNDFLPCIAAASGFDLAAGASVIVKARWPKSLVPARGTHACLLAAVLTKGDRPVAGRRVWESNNLAQKNLTIVDLKPNMWFVLPFVASNAQMQVARRFALEVIRPKEHSRLEASLLHRSGQVFKPASGLAVGHFDVGDATPDGVATTAIELDCAEHMHTHTFALADDGANGSSPGQSPPIITSDQPALLASQLFAKGVEVSFDPGERARIPITVRPHEQLLLGLKLKVPDKAKRGDTLRLDLVQRDAKTDRALGGIAVQINVL